MIQIERDRGGDAEVVLLILPDSGFRPSRGRRRRRLHVLRMILLRYDAPDFRQHGRRGAGEVIQGGHRVLVKIRDGGCGDGGELGPGQLDHRRLGRFRQVALRLEAHFRILDRAEHVALHVVHHGGGAPHALDQVRGDQFLG